MRKTVIGFTLSTLLLGLSSPVQAQQPGKIYRIGYLDPGPRSVNDAYLKALQKGLRELDWVEGKNIAFDYRFGDGKGLAYSLEFARELVRLNVDLIFAANASALRAMEATTKIPIVMIHPIPVEAGIVQSLARPGGNVTGLANLSAELTPKRLELLKEAVSRLTRVGVLMPAQRPTWERQSGLVLKDVEATARSLKLKLHELRVKVDSDKIDLESVFKIAVRERDEAVLVMPLARFGDERKRIAELAVMHRLPTIYNREFAEAGGLMSYGANSVDLYRRAAIYVDKILKGAKPADLPVEQPMKFELIINLKAAKQIGLTIPPNVLARADKIIK
jgi:putative tryptophan/tyrosine transport system substrate-binding protein